MRNHVFWLLCTFLLYACNKEIDYITTIPAFDNANIAQTDTFSIQAIIQRPDSILTSGNEYFKFGSVNDPVFGKINCRPVFRIGIPGDIDELTTQYSFDSLVITLFPSRSWQGDSTQPINVTVKRLSEDLENEDNVFYGHHRFATFSQELGKGSFIFRPTSADSIVIKLDHALGQEIFDMILKKSEIIETTEQFRIWMKGIELSLLTTGTGMMLELPRNDSAVRIRMHYHLDAGRREDLFFDFPVNVSSYAYTAMDIDRSGTPLAGLDTNNEMPVDVNSPFLYTHSYTGVTTVIAFPGIKEMLKTATYFSLIEAHLLVKPAQENYQHFPLPASLYMYFSNQDGQLEGPLSTAANDASQDGDLVFDGAYANNSSYAYDVTAFVQNELKSDRYTTRRMVLKNEDFSGSFTRLVAGLPGNNLYASKLVLSYLTYNP